MIGRTISHYKILEKLGEGGMGVVYKAEDTLLQRTVALKFLSQQALGAERERERFLREARAAASLDHSSICTVYEITEAEGQTFLAMSYIEGQTLREKLENGPLRVTQAVEIAMQVLDGLHEAHEKGITHRDIKSANIMVTEKWRAKILDFGLAQLPDAGRITIAGTTIGTASYMSPEQASGGTVDHRSDIWSVGAVLYEMLTAQLPFQGEYVPAILYSIVHEDPKPLEAVNERARAGLEAIVRRALAKKPEDRYQRVSDMAEELRAFLQNYEPTTASAEVRAALPDSGSGTAVAASPSASQTTAPLSPRRTALWAAAGVVVLAVLGFLARPFLGPPPPPMRDSASIAVLPLENLSGDPEQEFFADGMTEALITQLAMVNNLRVISRRSVMHYKDNPKPMQEIGRELRVDYIVEGSITKGADQFRITAQLIDPREDRHLWAQTYDRDMADVLALQSEVAEAITREVRIKLPSGGPDSSGAAAQAAVNPQEFEICMRARHYSHQQTAAGVALAIPTFYQALALEPDCPDAHSGLALTYGYLGVFGGVRPEDVMPKAKEEALLAISLREQSSEAHATLAAVHGFYEWNWADAHRELVRALELGPGTALPHFAYAQYYLIPMQRLDEAISQLRRALDLDPMSPQIHSFLGRALAMRGDYDAAIDELQKSLRNGGDFYLTHWALGMTYAAKQQHAPARAAFQKAHALDPENPFTIGGLAYIDALTGNKQAAIERVMPMTKSSPGGYVSPFWVAVVYAGLDDKDQAFHWLQKGIENRDPLVAFAAVLPELKNLRSDPRFDELLRAMNLRA